MLWGVKRGWQARSVTERGRGEWAGGPVSPQVPRPPPPGLWMVPASGEGTLELALQVFTYYPHLDVSKLEGNSKCILFQILPCLKVFLHILSQWHCFRKTFPQKACPWQASDSSHGSSLLHLARRTRRLRHCSHTASTTHHYRVSPQMRPSQTTSSSVFFWSKN